MGQATVDLPDPLQSPAAPATAGTDDLLAQLAGDEIERLLAETETDRPAAAAQAAPAPVPGASAVAAPPAAVPMPGEPASLRAGVATTPTDVASSAVVLDPKEDLATELDALLKSVDAAAPPAPPVPASAQPLPAAPVAAAASPAKPADIATSSTELKALGEPIATTDSAAVAADAAAALQEKLVADASADSQAAPPSLLIRLLELINSPLGQCSDAVRQTVGKIAIATLLNAIAVLVYALVFRHR